MGRLAHPRTANMDNLLFNVRREYRDASMITNYVVGL